MGKKIYYTYYVISFNNMIFLPKLIEEVTKNRNLFRIFAQKLQKFDFSSMLENSILGILGQNPNYFRH